MDGQRQLVRRPVRSSPIGEYSPECVIMPNLAYLNHYLLLRPLLPADAVIISEGCSSEQGAAREYDSSLVFFSSEYAIISTKKERQAGYLKNVYQPRGTARVNAVRAC